ncbi:MULTISPECIES: BID domain-containing T4SS effector [unclassified Bartonella]|uniref:BID domain-containing T4SS effector n=1 Tax=unclassified Bartonella TaxID=2645622 RepID=UPI000999A5E7|nr:MULTISPECIES: BID domain-containing T4SS effector [unclassified Bartonella]AQX27886.1 hypothetical protein BJB15x_004760 [Bartonella sp. JB15]AQX29166.1 hypothetical protein BJB63x_004740 [Bartonella sp. JB63]
MIKTTDFCVICYKDYFTPEQLRSLKFGDKITFTDPIAKNLDQILIPAEKLDLLTKKEIIQRIIRSTSVQENWKKVDYLSKLVYGDSKMLNQNLHLIHKNPEIGKQLAEQIENSPQSISNLAGFTLGIFNSLNVEKLKNISELSQVIEEYTNNFKRSELIY